MTYGLLLIGALVTIHAVGRYFMFKAEEKYEEKLMKYINDGDAKKESSENKEENNKKVEANATTFKCD